MVKEFLLVAGIAATLSNLTYPVSYALPAPIGGLNLPIEYRVYQPWEYDGQPLTATLGTIQGPTNRETYYNLDMSRVVRAMRIRGYDEVNYPYYIREDGVKMLGDYVMVSANLRLHPRGVLVRTSLGTGIVCDTGETPEKEDTYDIATEW